MSRALRCAGSFVALVILGTGTAVPAYAAQTLTEVDRVYGLSQVWSTVRTHFVHYESATFDWDSAYRAAIPLAQVADDDFVYYQVLRRLVASLGDSHTRVTPPSGLRSTHLRNFPLRTRLVEGRVVVVQVLSQELADAGLRAGMEILELDGMPVRAYAEEHVIPFEASSTRQDLDVRAFDYELFRGPADRPVELLVADAEGRTSRLAGSRRAAWDLARRAPPVEFDTLPGSIGYLRLNSFDWSSVIADFDSIYPQILRTRGLVIDIRENDGGSSTPGYHVLSHLVEAPFYGTHWFTRQTIGKFAAGSPSTEYFLHRRQTYAPVTDSLRYAGPVALIVGPRTYSAAEDFAVTFGALDRGPVVGAPSAGSSGEPIRLVLPGGGNLRVVTEHNVAPDGVEFVGVGVQPDITVEETVAALRAGRDLTLEAAVAAVRDRASRPGGAAQRVGDP